MTLMYDLNCDNSALMCQDLKLLVKEKYLLDYDLSWLKWAYTINNFILTHA